MRKLDFLTVFAVLALFAGCDYIRENRFSKERAEKNYRTAMEDYRAGRIDQAVDGLEKVCQQDPVNASARFQLGCLLQDGKKDYLGAVCAYREYLLQEPDSEKAPLARERIAMCERSLADQLADKFGINAVADEKRLSRKLQDDLKKAEIARKKLEKDNAEIMRRVKKLNEDLERYKNFLPDRRAIADEADVGADDIAAAKRELAAAESADQAEVASEIGEAKKLKDESAEEPIAPEEIADAKRLLSEEPEPEVAVITQSADAKAKREAAAAAAREEKKKEEARLAALMPKVETRPDTYEVKKGESLSDIAVRYYGRKSYWRNIREANKAVISADGRVKAGQVITLPPPDRK